MKPTTTIANSILHIAPRFSTKGSFQLVRLGNINGYGEEPNSSGELLASVFLCDTPIATRATDRQYTLINHDQPEIAEQLSSLSTDATLWVFVLDSEDAELIEKIRLFNIVSTVRESKSYGDDLTRQLLNDIGEHPRYQQWLSDHLGLKLLERGDRCPVNIASLAEILGMKNHASVSEHVRAGWMRYTSQTDNSETNTDTPQAERINRFPSDADAVPLSLNTPHPIEPTTSLNDELMQMISANIWNAFANEQKTADFETWYRHLKVHGQSGFAERFTDRVLEMSDDQDALLKLLDKITELVGTPDGI